MGAGRADDVERAGDEDEVVLVGASAGPGRRAVDTSGSISTTAPSSPATAASSAAATARGESGRAGDDQVVAADVERLEHGSCGRARRACRPRASAGRRPRSPGQTSRPRASAPLGLWAPSMITSGPRPTTSSRPGQVSPANACLDDRRARAPGRRTPRPRPRRIDGVVGLVGAVHREEDLVVARRAGCAGRRRRPPTAGRFGVDAEVDVALPRLARALGEEHRAAGRRRSRPARGTSPGLMMPAFSEAMARRQSPHAVGVVEPDVGDARRRRRRPRWWRRSDRAGRPRPRPRRRPRSANHGSAAAGDAARTSWGSMPEQRLEPGQVASMTAARSSSAMGSPFQAMRSLIARGGGWCRCRP